MARSPVQNSKWPAWAAASAHRSFIAPIALFVLMALFAPASADSRFGTVGKTEDFEWHRFYNADWSYLKGPADPHRMYTLAKLDHRAEPHLQWCRDALPKICLRATVESQRALYDSIFAYEKQRIPAILRHHSTRNSQPPPPLVFVIGNEPNAYPYVAPEVFAGIYKKYRDFIQGPVPEGLGCGHCRVHAGGLLLVDPMPQGAVFGALVSGTIRLSASLKAAREKGRAVVIHPFPEWTARFLDALHALGGSVDAFDVHLYYVDFVPQPFRALRLSWMRWKSDPDALESFIAWVQGGGGGTRTWRYPNPEIWVGEFGSLQPGQDSAAVMAQMEFYVAKFRTLPQVARWFWFKHSGRDYKLPDAPPVGLYMVRDGDWVPTAVGRHYIGLRRQGDQERFLSPKAARDSARATKTAPVPKAMR